MVTLCRDAGTEGGVLFSLVAIRGSSQRRAGARLMATADGRTIGTLGGGSFEADLLYRAAWFVRNGAHVHRLSIAVDDTGEVDLLAEPMQAPEADALIDALQDTLGGEHRTIATLLPSVDLPLQRFVMDAQGDVLFASESLETEDIVDLRRDALRATHGSVVGRMLVERIDPVGALVISGEDSRPEMETCTIYETGKAATFESVVPE